MTTYGTVREALAWLLACQQGPRYPSSPPLEPQIRAAPHRNMADLCRLVELIRGERVALPHCEGDLRLGEHGEVARCGRDSCLECEIRAYANEQIPREALSTRARALLKRAWRAMSADGMLRPRAPRAEAWRAVVDVLRYTDDDGQPADGPSPVEMSGSRPKRTES